MIIDKRDLEQRQLILIPTPNYIHSGTDTILAFIVNIDDKDDCVGCYVILRTGIWISQYVNVWVDKIISVDDDKVEDYVKGYDIDVGTWNSGFYTWENNQKAEADE